MLLGEDGSPGHVVPAASNPELAGILAEFARKYPDEARPESLRIRAITERKTMFYPEVDDALIRGITQSEPQMELMRKLRAHSVIAVPLIAHGEVIGALTLAVTAVSGRHYDQMDALSAEGFAQRAALALQNARMYTQAQETQEVLRELNAIKDEFVGMVSHELRTPITTVFSGARFLRSRAGTLDEQTAREVLDDIEQEAARLELIVENLLALARQEAGQQPELGPLPINRIVKAIVTRMQNLRPSRTFHLTPAEETPLATGVSIYMELVLRNLLDNADKYSPAGSPVEITARSNNGSVEVQVRDYGPGLNESDVERVFEQFYRAEGATGVSGTGVGLAVCRRLMESQDGEITLENHAEGGLQVTLSLPLFDDVDDAAVDGAKSR
jgi:K+-sensing histidine kinase KdpD